MRRSIGLGVCLLVWSLTGPQGAMADSVKAQLSGYHFTSSVAKLTQLAGGTSALVAELVAIRHDNETPFAAVRAEKLLLALATEPGVSSALLDDVRSPNFTGLARIVAVHIDEVTEPSVRQQLATTVLSRASSDKTYAPYARSLLRSSDSAVSAAARVALGQ